MLIISFIVICYIKRSRRRSIVVNIIAIWLRHVVLIKYVYNIRIG